jgi:hypothetical protein
VAEGSCRQWTAQRYTARQWFRHLLAPDDIEKVENAASPKQRAEIARSELRKEESLVVEAGRPPDGLMNTLPAEFA